MVKKILLMFLLFLAFNFVQAVNLKTATNIDVLMVNVFHNNKWSGWNKTAVVRRGDKLWFHIHAYANGGDVVGLISKLENINNKSYHVGDRVTISAFVDADNASRLNDQVQLYFLDNITIKYSSYKWAIKRKGSKPEANEHVKPLPNGQKGTDALKPNGVWLGNLANEYRSNLLLSFSTGVYNLPIPGVCGVRKNSCLKGQFKDILDDQDYYKWRCLGGYGGQSKDCVLKKIPVNGRCSTTRVNGCISGYLEDVANSSKNYLWICKGLNGGNDMSCQIEKKPINAICSKKTNKCVRGKFKDLPDTKTEKKWTCLGYYGGKDVKCSAKKWCLCEDLQSSQNTFANVKYINESIESDSNEIISNLDKIRKLKNLNSSLKEEKEKILNEKKYLNEKIEKLQKNKFIFCEDWYWMIFILVQILLIILIKKIFT